MSATREQLHGLIDALPESEMGTAYHVLEALAAFGNRPFLRMLAEAEEDDEPLTAEEEALLEEGRQQLRRGESRTLEEVRRELLGG